MLSCHLINTIYCRKADILIGWHSYAKYVRMNEISYVFMRFILRWSKKPWNLQQIWHFALFKIRSTASTGFLTLSVIGIHGLKLFYCMRNAIKFYLLFDMSLSHSAQLLHNTISWKKDTNSYCQFHFSGCNTMACCKEFYSKVK